MRREPRVALTWIGDGGASMGDFHEGLNFAATLRLPFVLILENNHWAYSTPVARQCAQTDFLKRADAYGIPGVGVDGNDVLAVYEATREAAARAREGGGPTLIVAETFRMKGHAEHDDFSYVPPEEIALWEGRDPIARFERALLAEGRLDEAGIEASRARARLEMDEAESFALASPYPDPADAANGVYAGG
jgi:pyruvate dehydrogenase E1 component alpha subunit